jgi:hypothetical protein
MANLYLLHEPNDTRLISQLESFLKRNGNTVDSRGSIRPRQNDNRGIQELMREADGIIVVIDHGSHSDLFNEEIRIALDGDRDFKSIVVLMEGNNLIPEELRSCQRFVTDTKHSLQQQAGFINDYFKKYLNQASNSRSGTDVQAFWLIKINDETWPIADFRIGQPYSFNSRHHQGEKQADAALFEQVKVHDRLLAYAYSHINAVVAIFRVTHHDIVLSPEDIVLGLELDALIEPRITNDELVKHGFTGHHSSHETNKLFALDGTVVSEMISARSLTDGPTVADISVSADNPVQKLLSQQAAFTAMSNDMPDAAVPDKLDIMDDVRAMAMVIAYEKVKPPISIGLFGNWGSGKSFFMLKLEKEINALVEKKTAPFNTEVVSIRFNSWHYSDANLWASLITRIFEGLKAHGGSKKSELDKLFQNLSSTTELINETEQREKALGDQIEAIKTRANDLENSITEKAQQLSGMSFRAITVAVFQDEKVKADLRAIQKDFDYVDLSTYEQIGKKADELERFGSQTVKTLQLAYDFRRPKTLIMLAVAAIVFGLAYYASDLAIIIKPWYQKIQGYAAVLLAAMTQAAALIAPAGKKIGQLQERLVSLKKKMEELREIKVKEFEGEKEKLKSELIAAETAQKELAVQRQQLESRKAEISLELDDIRSGKKLQSFIESRVTDERYQNNLGIISWIRKDFEKLDFLLKQQHDPKLLKESGQESVPDIFKIDRIVLYIDDLDRCDKEIVIQVLEAIHLLLAFPLFVVVVGVDPRWMNNALRGRFDQLSSADFDINKTDGEEKEEAARQQYLKLPITSQAYLEKIFQIPFVLKPMSDNTIGDLIGAQFSAIEEKIDEDNSDENQQKEPAITDPADPDKSFINSSLPSQPETLHQEEVFHLSSQNGNNHIPSRQALDLLVLAPEEIAFMKSLGGLAGDSPRTIVRFVNIYRIIRSHADLVFEQDTLNEHYYAVMFLLSVITGSHPGGKTFLEALKAGDPNATFKSYSQSLQKAKATKNRYSTILKGTAADGVMKQLGGLKISIFQANIDLVCRFSFHIA